MRKTASIAILFGAALLSFSCAKENTVKEPEPKLVSITVEDCARASGLSKTTITEQAREDAKTGGCELGFYGIIANSRVSIIRTSFLNFIDHGRGGETA